MKLRYWFLCGLPLGLLINHLLVGFFKFTAGVALKLRPELINLSFWEAFWSMHYRHWIWLVNPQMAYIAHAIIFILLGGLVALYVGLMVE